MGLTRLKSGCQQGCVLSGGSEGAGENLFPCLFQLLNTMHILAHSLSLPSTPHVSLSHIPFLTVTLLLPAFTVKEPRAHIQDNLCIIVRSLITHVKSLCHVRQHSRRFGDQDVGIFGAIILPTTADIMERSFSTCSVRTGLG